MRSLLYIFIFLSIPCLAQKNGATLGNQRRDKVDVPVIPPYSPRDYYVCTGCSGDGTTSGLAGPASLITSATFNPNDQIFLKKGDTYTIGEINLPVNGIKVNSWGSGAAPIVDGSNSLSAASWTSEGSGVYSTTISQPKWVWDATGVSMHNAESAWLPIDVNVSTQVRSVNQVTVNAFTTSIVGAPIIAKEYNFRMSETLTASAYNSTNGDITFTGTLVGADPGMPIKVVNMKQFISVNGDWAWEGGKLYVKSATDPTGTDIRIGVKDYAFFANNSSGIEIKNIELRHFYKYAIYNIAAQNLKVDNCYIHDNRGLVLRVVGSNQTGLIFTNNVTDKNALGGIEYAATHTATITGNTFLNIGTDANYGRPFDGAKFLGLAIGAHITYTPADVYVMNGATISGNTIHDVAYSGMHIFGSSNTVTHNEIYNYCAKFADGGGIYESYGDYLTTNGGNTTGNLIQQNYIHDGIGNTEGIIGGAATFFIVGIYNDNGSDTNTIDGNIIVNPGYWGILGNLYTTGHIITNNTVVGALSKAVSLKQNSNGLAPYFHISLMTNVVMTGNKLAGTVVPASTAYNGVLMEIFNQNNNASFNPFLGTGSLNNNHYIQPYSANITSRTITGGPPYTPMTLAQLQTYTGKEASGTTYNNYKVSATAGDVMVQVNFTGSSASFSIPAGYTDDHGNTPSNPYTIPAWGSLIYLKQ